MQCDFANIFGDYQGQWESTVTYKVKPIFNTYYQASPIVTDSAGTFIMSGESQAESNVKPENESAAWDMI